MCGISGIINTHSSQEEKSLLLRQMIQIQNHRGPDSNGVFIDAHVGLAHNRLSLLDLSDNGNQPFEDSKFALIFNGEIYNYQELKSELPERKYTSTSDTEVLFWSLKTLGVEKTLKSLKGMFAFAWYDKETHKISLCRDPLGIKPLFYGKSKNGTFVFASELKTIVNLFDFTPNPAKIIYASLGILEKSIDYTAFKDVFQVSPGHFIEIENGVETQREYFNLLDLVSENEYNRLLHSKEGDVIDEFELLLKNATNSMLVSDAPMGCFVSGGVDSSLIATYAAQEKHDFNLFTANVLGQYSEIEYTKILSHSIGKTLYEYEYEKEVALGEIAKVIWHYDSPLITHFNAIAFSKVAALAQSHGVKAVLTGEGADELFLGYPKLLTKRYDKFIHAPFSIINGIYSKVPGLSSYISKDSRSEGLLSILEQSAQNFTRQYLRKEGVEKYHFLNSKDALEAYQTAEMLRDRLVSLLWRNDRMGMINSIESRFPFLDESILKFSLNLPVKYKIGRTNKFHNYKHPFMMDKMVVRKAAVRVLPNRIADKQKFGFATNDLRDIVVSPDFLRNGVLAEYLGLSNKGIDHMAGQISNYHFSLLASTEVWAKLFVQRMSVEEVTSGVLKNFAFKN